MAEAVVALLVDEAEAGFLVDVAGGEEDAVGPQRDLPVPGLAGE
jgi:hypothetical protein